MEDLDSLKHDPRILQVYGHYTSLRREGAQWVGLCPLHQERSGSFKIRFYEGTYLWSCHGCDQSGGNIFQLIEKKDGCTFKEAVEKVKKILGESMSTWQRDAVAVDSVFHPIQEAPKTFKTYTLFEYAGFEKNLPEAIHFLDRRGISLETARRLHLGYRKSVSKLAGEKNQDIADSGWLAMPRIEGDTVVGIHYRSVVEGRKAFCRQPGMQTALFNTQSIDMFEPIYVCEGEMDSCVLEQAGYRSISIPSASTNLTPAQKDQIMAAGTVILAGDCDDGPGSEKMNKLWRELSERTYLLKWPAGMKDANQTLLEYCKGDYTKFKEEVDRLTQQAKTTPMPDVYSLQEVMKSSGEFSLQDDPRRLRFPWPSVDKMAVLLPGSVLAVYSTSTGMGKSTWAHQVGLHNAMKQGKVVLNYQCEMQPEEIGVMTAAQILRKNRNFLTKDDQAEAARALDGVQYYIGANQNLSSADAVLDLIEAAIRRFSVDLVIIDHFHHICADLTNENAVQSLAAQRIKQLAEKYQCIFISVGQPRKAIVQKQGKVPHISDAKGSEAYTSKASAVFALHRALNKTDDDTPQNDMYEAKMLVQAQKTRAKGTGAVEAYLTGFLEFACFEEIDYRYGENSPE